jgi:hypothetical protein
MKSLSLIALAALTLLAACSSTKSDVSMSPEQMQEAMVAYGTPGPHHKLLDPMVGTFQTKVTSRMSPDQPWEESTGTCTNRWIFDGRFLESNFRGEFMGMPFEGRGLNGYDNSTQEFVGFWTDSWSTGLAPISRGTADASGTVITLHRKMQDPLTGQPVRMCDVTTIQGPKSHKMESYCETDDTPEFLMMTIEFTR